MGVSLYPLFTLYYITLHYTENMENQPSNYRKAGETPTADTVLMDLVERTKPPSPVLSTTITIMNTPPVVGEYAYFDSRMANAQQSPHWIVKLTNGLIMGCHYSSPDYVPELNFITCRGKIDSVEKMIKIRSGILTPIKPDH